MRLPRIKPEHAAYCVGDKIRIGSPIFGVAAEINDPDGIIWEILRRMDGAHTTGEIAKEIVACRETVDRAAVLCLIQSVLESGYAEDAGSPDPPELTEREKERYSRSRKYFRWLDLSPRGNTWEPQIALRRATITVLGMGGTGTVAATALAASGVGRLHCVDGDTVELSNLNRQILYTEDDIGRPKIEVALSRLRGLNSDIEVTGDAHSIPDAGAIARLAAQSSAVLLTADHPQEIRTWANRACIATGTPWVDAGYTGPLVSVGTYVPGSGACRECVASDEAARHRGPPGVLEELAAGDAASSAVSAGLSGYLAAHALISLITGVPPTSAGQILALSLAAPGEMMILDYPVRTDCPGCGGNPQTGPRKDQR